jgi:hypothetical protein
MPNNVRLQLEPLIFTCFEPAEMGTSMLECL